MYVLRLGIGYTANNATARFSTSCNKLVKIKLVAFADLLQLVETPCNKSVNNKF